MNPILAIPLLPLAVIPFVFFLASPKFQSALLHATPFTRYPWVDYSNPDTDQRFFRGIRSATSYYVPINNEKIGMWHYKAIGRTSPNPNKKIILYCHGIKGSRAQKLPMEKMRTLSTDTDAEVVVWLV